MVLGGISRQWHDARTMTRRPPSVPPSDPDLDTEDSLARLQRIEALLDKGLEDRGPAHGPRRPPQTVREAMVRGLRKVAERDPEVLVKGLRGLARRGEDL